MVVKEANPQYEASLWECIDTDHSTLHTALEMPTSPREQLLIDGSLMISRLATRSLWKEVSGQLRVTERSRSRFSQAGTHARVSMHPFTHVPLNQSYAMGNGS
jgi:hypothetical protein